MTATLSADQITGEYSIDPSHSRIGFAARHAMIAKVRGGFNEFEGTGHFDFENPSQSSLQLTIKVDSIDTRSADRDNHLRTNDFFDIATYPEIKFVSTGVEKVDDETFRVTGDLTVKDVTKSLTFDLEYMGAEVDPFQNQRVGLEGSVVVNRKDFGLTWNAMLESGGVLVGEKVTLEFEVSAVKAQ
ncbi:MAG TPA: YceI family protein [Microthrixaceae bacterium]|nr:YceI family protein [Microthrixaceae bacterium]